MLRLSKICIGTKLAIMSGLGVLLVGAMIATLMWGNSAVRYSNADVIRRASLVQNALDAKASLRGMQVGVRDVRLASSAADLEKAKAYLGERKKSADKFIDHAIEASSLPGTIETLKAIKGLADQYETRTKEIVAVKA